ncbi:MAG: uroporphyrinogen-III C-methyltransferase [Terriglobia bacterium]
MGATVLIQAGKVYLVGAGPGHPELLTLKAAELLKAADVIVYDRLIQEDVLALAKVSAERIYMGKPLGKHDSRQTEIDELLLRKAREGKLVVRLKGGDPFLFGRGGEEAEFLAEHDVPFEVIPGVSSALAAPLSAGIAVTHRDAASSVAIITGHEATKDTSRVDWDALRKLDTLVFLMGVHNVRRISQELIAHGRDPATPAAMIQMAFWPEERVVTGTLGSIAGEVERAGIGPPATLVVGNAVRLREKLKNSQRDLHPSEVRPSLGLAPMPDQLLRMAMAGLGSQVLGFALSLGLFDQMEEWQSAFAIARLFDLHTSATAEILDSLVALGLLECTSEGYRNLELASVYLRSEAPQSLKPVLLHQLAEFSRWEAVAAYARSGRPGDVSSGQEAFDFDCCECLAGFSAPAVVNRLDLAEKSPVLLLGWGGDAYRAALARRWPDLALEIKNPLVGHAPQPPPQANTYGAVVLSGLVARSAQEEDRTLEVSAAALQDDGVLVLHDAFLPNGVLPPQVVLGALGRHLTCRPSGNWSIDRLRAALETLGLRDVCAEYLPAGTVIVKARKGRTGPTKP